MSDALSHLLRVIAAKCEELELNFSIVSDWDFVLSAEPQFVFGWVIESGKDNERDASYSYETLEDCLSDCIDHLTLVEGLRNDRP